ncbi:related to P.falciparum liver stage antigen LSA-1 [Cephalotrichum gorgonifer]|uniref:Related to P.falciparum liver stage antigen LSA-1 n=1 Tax=Cephalotrichum gorgonifer TaxID=2041049 RepID=A0AAE8N201_9PEZI|nr:related to P.falciparum liver stage antigen LSA-1 [Cephalotrichum gorgonifer]
MAGRQAHGRAITAKASGKSAKKAKAKKTDAGQHRARALDAYTLASAELPVEKAARGPRHRNPDIEDEDGPRPKHSRDSDNDGGDSEEEGPRRKKAKAAQQSNEDGSDVEYGTDGEGNEWRVGAIGEDDDSEIDSDEAFGESDLEDFDGYAFRGSKSNQSKKGEEDVSEDEDDDESLGDDAIDLATALDQAEEESEEDAEEGSDDGSDDEDEDDESDSTPEEEDDDDDDEDIQDKDALKSLVADFAGVVDDDENKSKRPKIDLKDLALTGLNDANMRKSLKLMTKEEKELRPGATKKLVVPLAKRQQDRVLRKAAYEKTTETLDRWTDTIKHNRRAEHLVFPLPQDLPNAVLSNPDMQPLKSTTATSELEKTMFSLLEQSGLSLEKEPKKPKGVSEEEFQQLSKQAQKELIAERRLERETQSREAKRAARLKKIKSKAYHRVHRKQKQKEEMATREAMEAAGEIDSEEEREAQDRIRALERVGQRHKNSSWAKAGSKVKRAVWDDDYRAGLTDMARRDEELRRRVEGRGIDDDSEDEESSEYGSESEDERERLKRQLEKAAAPVDDTPQKGLMGLKFMKREEERRKLANDELVKQIKKDLASDDDEVSEEEEGEVGRRKFGMGHADSLVAAEKKPEKRKARKAEADGGEELAAEGEAATAGGVTPGPRYIVQTDSIGGAWSKGEARRKSKKKSGPSTAEPLDLNASILLADVSQPKPNNKSKSKPGPKAKDAEAGAVEEEVVDSDEGEDIHLPLAIRDQELIARAFAGDDVVAQFEEEKEEMAVDQGDKVVDNTLPGWGSWGGEGIAKGNRKRHLTKIEGVKRKDRQDSKLERVIINEKKVKKNDKYLASHLPHQYESQAQYEGTLRLPVGKDFVTKETFQAGTKPRVIIKQGIIAPMSRPVV